VENDDAAAQANDRERKDDLDMCPVPDLLAVSSRNPALHDGRRDTRRDTRRDERMALAFVVLAAPDVSDMQLAADGTRLHAQGLRAKDRARGEVMDVSWLLALGWALWLVQIIFTISTQRRLEEAHKREGEYCAMLDRFRNERRTHHG
jgi:hypothetical protein